MSNLIPLSNTESVERKGDVIFVHGLDGNHRATWLDTKESTFWPDWLGEDLSDVGIWSLDYEAASLRWKGYAMLLEDRAKNVIDELLHHSIGLRPIVFVTHSLGGLLVKEILFTARTSGIKEWRPIAQATRGVVFFGTPHSGSDVANWITFFKRFSLPNVSVEELRHHAPALAKLNSWYRNNVEEMDVATIAYSEGREVKGLVLVVDKESADPQLPGVSVIPIERNHMGLCKLTSKDQCYKGVLNFIRARLSLDKPAVDPEVVEAELRQLSLEVLRNRLPEHYEVGTDDRRIENKFTAFLRSHETGKPLFCVKLGSPFDSVLRPAMSKLAFDTDWLNFYEKETFTPMFIAIVAEVKPQLVEEALSFLRENLGHPTSFGRLLVRIAAGTRFEGFSTKEIQILLDPAQKLWVFA